MEAAASLGDAGDAGRLLYSDSNYECRLPEFHHFRKWMRPGSIVVFHDTAPGRGAHRLPDGIDLRGQVEQLAGECLVSLVHLPTPRGVTVGELLR